MLISFVNKENSLARIFYNFFGIKYEQYYTPEIELELSHKKEFKRLDLKLRIGCVKSDIEEEEYKIMKVYSEILKEKFFSNIKEKEPLTILSDILADPQFYNGNTLFDLFYKLVSENFKLISFFPKKYRDDILKRMNLPNELGETMKNLDNLGLF